MKRSTIQRIQCGLLVGGIAAMGLIASGVAPQPKEFETDSRWLDDRLPGAEAALLKETVGFAFPGFEEYESDLKWLANEPESDALKGKVLILQSFTSADPQRRSVLRRAENLSRRVADDAIFIAVHTPENAEDAERFAARSTIPVVLDTTGRFCDDLGIWKSPVAVVVDRAGVIRMVGANVLQSARFVPEIASEEASGEAPKLPNRSEREEAKGEGDDKPVEKAEFPEPPAVSGANDLTNKKGPELVVQKYLGPEPKTEGKVVMVVFWATWCGPCIAGIPHQNMLHNAFPDDLVIIGLTAEDEGVVNTFRSRRDRTSAEYVTAIDPQRRVSSVVGNRFIPHCIVMSSDGIVRWQGSPRDLTRAAMEAIVDANKALGAAQGDGVMRWVVKAEDESAD